ncbi:hypothetical protein, partial [Deinococcus piscis]|uniref:hypothetical protein n=1 Tax=Deinococcus piscis TaxID=394230 RepID=UPI001E5D7358
FRSQLGVKSSDDLVYTRKLLTTTYSCVNNNSSGTSVPSGASTSMSFTPKIGDDIVCTFANNKLIVSPEISLWKYVRNVNKSGEVFSSSGTNGFSGDNLQYCIAYSNIGGDAPNFKITDLFPENTTNHGNLIFVTPAPDFTALSSSPVAQTVPSPGTYQSGFFSSNGKTGPGVELSLGTLAAGNVAAPTTGAICFDAEIR